MSDISGLLGDDDLVTGEAVALELPPATVGLRMASGLIDLVVALLLLVGCVAVALTSVADADAALAAVAAVGSLVTAAVVLPTALETLTRGRSLGKLALGLRTVRDDAGPISFRHALIRALVGFVEIWLFLGVPALFCSLLNGRGKRMGDLVAGTYVVRQRFHKPPVRDLVMPRELAGWAGGADMAPLPDALALAAREFLRRATTLNPGSRATLGAQLADQVMAHVAPPPPAGHHPEAVLAAVLAERRRRDEARLARDQRLRERLLGRLR